ncbi:cation:proton antiporter [Amycolatopsis mongoliensis]|uniref:Cation:proton antiporter n=1 Tax=Amycolatopsis mongoliensis TaxID=715475 RepID=A0A9Y2K126_9PSEU|nr:cation:proton antiporter [Amycolatopsis sp. 4-36]WIY07600.1 cation:proton antiporter [Amycolatopsis sp. 4-36]
MVGLLDRDTASHPRFRVELDAIGYGFLIPVFFVTSGLRLDLGGLPADPVALARVPLFLAALLLTRGVPALLYTREFGRRRALAAALLQATSLPFLVTASQIGVLTGSMSPVARNGSARVRRPVVGARLPRGALSLLRSREEAAVR